MDFVQVWRDMWLQVIGRNPQFSVTFGSTTLNIDLCTIGGFVIEIFDIIWLSTLSFSLIRRLIKGVY